MAGGAIVCMSLVEKSNTDPHTQARGSGGEFPGEKEGAWVVMASSAPCLSSSAFFHTVSSGYKTSKVKGFKCLHMSTYTLGRWEKIFQFLESEAQQIPLLLPEDIKRAKG